MKPQALILRTAGTNCDEETAFAFELAGAEAHRVHLNRILENPSLLKEFQLLAIPGGFSYGDDISSGKILANRIRIHLAEELAEFVAADKPIIGICNGFQVLVKAGLLPGPIDRPISVTLAHNDSGRFIDQWIHLSVRSNKCIWLEELRVSSCELRVNTGGIHSKLETRNSKRLPNSQLLMLPVAHGEGKFVAASDAVVQSLWDDDQIAFVYATEDGEPAGGKFPANPNGSVADIAGICDSTGLILGLMPHPERYVNPRQHPAWSRQNPMPDHGAGLELFRSAVRYVGGQIPTNMAL